ncbi:LysR family transcriptional regulator [Ferrimonas lipolytica]|uniref:LysR family transcriptional regulator n=1 Tax=Ferrimonas lipolytica TaxID=2724191 RepID=A0A6H1U9Q9_9GAMM|nr:LysR family transcriptional regulator [Ferrimonas lipolytica]QIZ75764.1 LysR family transcriptional regulator [Ferrimonas lipolytica]
MKSKEMTNLYWFCQAVAHGGFAAASAATNTSAPTISRAVVGLEEAVGEKLLHRNAKLFQLTAAGERYYRQFSPIMKKLEEEWDSSLSSSTELTGDIRISCPEPFADHFLQPAAFAFMQQHPKVNIHIDFASDAQNFFEDQIDLAISTNPPTVMDLIQRKLFQLDLALAASPAYLAEHGTPKSLADLPAHNLLSGNKLDYWEFMEQGELVRINPRSKYSIDSLRLVMQAAIASMGVCLIPLQALKPCLEQGTLVQLMPDTKPIAGAVYMVWTDRKLESARSKAFREMLIERLSDEQAFVTNIADS